MLQKLTFNITNMNNNDVGVTYYQDENYIMGIADPSHHVWEYLKRTEPFSVLCIGELEDGIYGTSSGNFIHDLDDTDFMCNDAYSILNRNGKVVPTEEIDWDNYDQYFSPYGVADNIEQVKEKFKDLIDSENPICISFSVVRKKDQPEDGGWRWHKWGEYIGTQAPQYEYLYDEESIDEVILYHVYALDKREL